MSAYIAHNTIKMFFTTHVHVNKQIFWDISSIFNVQTQKKKIYWKEPLESDDVTYNIADDKHTKKERP